MSQDAIDPRIATDDEKAHLDEWKNGNPGGYFKACLAETA
ncbi:hypothetical protein SEEM031_21675 [Salmonella enterica subsp. enterica serovar Montevideo str. SARB31]|nr:hypothetical protein SEEM031_21675 [Salmonella enterica subsp. enterica serovar Montevideo str. SARB31]